MKEAAHWSRAAVWSGWSEARSGQSVDGLHPTQAYWFSMFAASALGTNLGDFWVDALSLNRAASFFTLALISGMAVWFDRQVRLSLPIGYWVAIVALRAGATNVGDYLTHDLALSYLGLSIVLAIATLIAGSFTHADSLKTGIPGRDRRYWSAMFMAGIFGTIGGDLASHTFGLYAASGLLCLVLAAVLVACRGFASTPVMVYWLVVLAERCAGTPTGDALASRRAVGLGLPLAMSCTGGLLIIGLLTLYWPLRSPRRGRLAAYAPSSSDIRYQSRQSPDT